MKWRVEVEETRRGFVTLEAEDGESRAHLHDRATALVEDELAYPCWEPDEVQVISESSAGLRCYAADAECQPSVGSITAYCATHDEPLLVGLTRCQRRLDDLAEQDDPAGLWGAS